MTLESGGDSTYLVAAAWAATMAHPEMKTATASAVMVLAFIMNPFPVRFVEFFMFGVYLTQQNWQLQNTPPFCNPLLLKTMPCRSLFHDLNSSFATSDEVAALPEKISLGLEVTATHPPIITVGQPRITEPPCAVGSPMRAAGVPPIITVVEPIAIVSGGPTQTSMSPTTDAGMLPIKTVGAPGPVIGPPTCGIGGRPGVTIGHTCISVKRAAIGIIGAWPICVRASSAETKFADPTRRPQINDTWPLAIPCPISIYGWWILAAAVRWGSVGGGGGARVGTLGTANLGTASLGT